MASSQESSISTLWWHKITATSLCSCPKALLLTMVSACASLLLPHANASYQWLFNLDRLFHETLLRVNSFTDNCHIDEMVEMANCRQIQISLYICISMMSSNNRSRFGQQIRIGQKYSDAYRSHQKYVKSFYYCL